MPVTHPAEIAPPELNHACTADEFFAEGAYAQPHKDDFRAFDGVFPELPPAHSSLLVGVGNDLWVRDYKVDPNGGSP